MFVRAVVLALALTAGAIAPATAFSAGAPQNLVATPAVKAALRLAFLRGHRQYPPARVAGPLKGATYYGRLGRFEYAFATFSVPRVGKTDQPEEFRRVVGGAWRDLGDTGGEICKSEAPLALLELWHLRPIGAGCFAAASARVTAPKS